MYVSIFRKFVSAGSSTKMYNASISTSKRHASSVVRSRFMRVLIDKYPESEWSKRALYLIGANYHALAIYNTRSTTLYIRIDCPGEDGSKCTDAEKTAGARHRPRSLQNAIFFRLGLGDNGKTYEKNYTHKFPGKHHGVKYSLGSKYERRPLEQGHHALHGLHQWSERARDARDS